VSGNVFDGSSLQHYQRVNDVIYNVLKTDLKIVALEMISVCVLC